MPRRYRTARQDLVAQSNKVESSLRRLRLGHGMEIATDVAVAVRPVAAGDRDVELGIAPHAVLGHVQAGRLGVFLDTDAPETLHRPEARERGRERERAD